MPGKIEIKGRPASPGICDGPILALQRPRLSHRPAQGPKVEAEVFNAAIQSAANALAKIADRTDGDAADILEFQIAMLEDEALSEPALAAIAQGAAAQTAWSQAIGAQIANYEAADTEYFRARAADLTDIADRVLAAIDGGGDEAPPPPGTILLGHDITPSQFLAADWDRGGGIATGAGSPSSHVAMLARARGVPMVVGLGAIATDGHDRAAIDGGAGALYLSPDAQTLTQIGLRKTEFDRMVQAQDQARKSPARTACGTAIEVAVNISGPDDLKDLDPAFTDGVGLVRTEFLFGNLEGLTDEERQFAAYRDIVDWAAGRPVTIRTTDAGGDKPIPGYTAHNESDPFLGLRGVRLSLARPEIFRIQLRAMARAAKSGPVRIMLPMVTAPGEITAARAHLDAVIAELAADGTGHGRPQLGMMVEVPAAAFTLEDFAVDFASIGSNDLVQYMTASARDNTDVAAVYDPGHRGVEIALRAAVRAAAAAGFPISICGDAAGDPVYLPMVLGTGLRSLSVAISALGRAKQALAALDLEAGPA